MNVSMKKLQLFFSVGIYIIGTMLSYGEGRITMSNYTVDPTSCSCNYSPEHRDCACCVEGGCQCPHLSATSAQTCVECGLEETCHSELEEECTLVSGAGCLVAEGLARQFSKAGMACARLNGVLPSVTTWQSWVKIAGHAESEGWDNVWTGARIKHLDWQWSKSCQRIQFQGCYEAVRELDDESFLHPVRENVTAETCIRRCAQLRFEYAHVQFEEVEDASETSRLEATCRCDHNPTHTDPSRYTGLATEDCDRPCTRISRTEYTCGGRYRQLMFYVQGFEFEAWDPMDDSHYNCAMLDVTTQTWSRSECTNQRAYICEYPGLSALECASEDYRWVAQRCVSMRGEALSWHAATSNCAQRNGYLVQVDNKELHDTLLGTLPSFNRYWWIGLTNRQLIWPDGRAVTSMVWAAREPVISAGHRLCVELSGRREYRARTADCQQLNHVLCQIEYGFTSEQYAALMEEYQQMELSALPEDAPSDAPPVLPLTGSSEANTGESNTTGIAVGVTLGLLLAILLIAAAVVLVRYKRKKRSSHSENNHVYMSAVTPGNQAPVSGPGASSFTRHLTYDHIDDALLQFRPSNGLVSSNGHINPALSLHDEVPIKSATEHPLRTTFKKQLERLGKGSSAREQCPLPRPNSLPKVPSDSQLQLVEEHTAPKSPELPPRPLNGLKKIIPEPTAAELEDTRAPLSRSQTVLTHNASPQSEVPHVLSTQTSADSHISIQNTYLELERDCAEAYDLPYTPLRRDQGYAQLSSVTSPESDTLSVCSVESYILKAEQNAHSKPPLYTQLSHVAPNKNDSNPASSTPETHLHESHIEAKSEGSHSGEADLVKHIEDKGAMQQTGDEQSNSADIIISSKPNKPIENESTLSPAQYVDFLFSSLDSVGQSDQVTCTGSDA